MNRTVIALTSALLVAVPAVGTAHAEAVPVPHIKSSDANCEYLLGDFTETSSGFRFVLSGTIRNVGNIAVYGRLVATFRQTSGPSIKVSSKAFLVPRNRSRFVNGSRVVSSDEIDQVQAIDTNAQCKLALVIVRTYGKAA